MAEFKEITSTAKINRIIEGASELVNSVVLSICQTPPVPLPGGWQPSTGYAYQERWATAYYPIRDLNVLSPKGEDQLTETQEYVDRFPKLVFFVDEVQTDLLKGGEEHCIGSLGAHIEVMQPTFALLQQEIFEIHSAVRRVLNLSKSLAELVPRFKEKVGDVDTYYDRHGGLIHNLCWTKVNAKEPTVDDDRNYYLSLIVFWNIWFTEDVYQ